MLQQNHFDCFRIIKYLLQLKSRLDRDAAYKQQ